MFVKARGNEGMALGIGKLVERTGKQCTVEYFDAPTSEPIIRQFESNQIQVVSLPEQTRVYHFNQTVGAWEIGRILDDLGDSRLIRFPNGTTKHLKVADIFVRWARPIADPTPFLGGKINETPRFADSRSAFVRSLLSQRAASMGMSALTSSAIELEAHQIEVVRRICRIRYSATCLPTKLTSAKRSKLASSFAKLSRCSRRRAGARHRPRPARSAMAVGTRDEVLLRRLPRYVIHVVAIADDDRIRRCSARRRCS